MIRAFLTATGLLYAPAMVAAQQFVPYDLPDACAVPANSFIDFDIVDHLGSS